MREPYSVTRTDSLLPYATLFRSRLARGGPGRAIEIQLADLGLPARQRLQVDVVLFELGIGEVAGVHLLGDLALEVVALVDEFLVGVVAVGLEAGDDLFQIGRAHV